MSATPSARILVVDGDPAAREQLARVLGAEGFAVSLAPDGRAALDLVLARPFDLLLADAALLRTVGPQLHALVRSLGFGGAVVWMRADRRPAAAHTGHPTAIVRKPVDRPTLLAAIDRALARRVSGNWSDPATGEGGAFAGTLTVAGVERHRTELSAVGSIDGHAGAFGRVTDTFRAPVTDARVSAASTDQDTARPVLYLELGPVRLELLRLAVELPEPIEIDLGEDPGLYPGILMDAVATLRDRGAPLGNLAYLLN